MFPLISLLLFMTTCDLVFTQITDIVNSCKQYKETVFEEKVAYSFLFPNAPVIYDTVDNCHSYTPLIVNGLPAEPKEFPHMARLGHRTNPSHTDWFCGGMLISKFFVLTAAHCFETNKGEVNVVRLGELDFGLEDEDALPQDYAVEDYFRHPNFSYPVLYNDIGLVKLREGVKFDSYKHPVCLPIEDGSQKDWFIAVGWGSTALGENSSSKLRKVKLERYGDSSCRTAIEQGEDFPQGFEPITQMCVGSDETRDTCNGDSGGPILIYHKDYPCMYNVMGVTSAGIGCGTPKIPSVYTRVFYYLDWIRDTITKNSGSNRISF